LNPVLLLGHVLIVIKISKKKIVFQMENIAQSSILTITN
jgi:hypothetical protein